MSFVQIEWKILRIWIDLYCFWMMNYFFHGWFCSIFLSKCSHIWKSQHHLIHFYILRCLLLTKFIDDWKKRRVLQKNSAEIDSYWCLFNSNLMKRSIDNLNVLCSQFQSLSINKKMISIIIWKRKWMKIVQTVQ